MARARKRMVIFRIERFDYISVIHDYFLAQRCKWRARTIRKLTSQRVVEMSLLLLLLIPCYGGLPSRLSSSNHMPPFRALLPIEHRQVIIVLTVCPSVPTRRGAWRASPRGRQRCAPPHSRARPFLPRAGAARGASVWLALFSAPCRLLSQQCVKHIARARGLCVLPCHSYCLTTMRSHLKPPVRSSRVALCSSASVSGRS